ncbi:AMP-binding protein [Actinophytocola oryzae]|uniref:Fatty-acyl-CoA synthase n=1 Tax=Actinophytocola oryzae TaxID=502181 RepID=A0A4R7VRA7_9PSEU|nr:AMP-binding protein [Actinophytocola oryzae]TDV52316.1 fatty-acyl-CoA synthase [Actinophytocola oryzae]
MSTVVDTIISRLGGPGSLRVLGADGAEHTASWAAIHQRARRLATLLTRQGIGPGSRVALLADTSVDLVTTIQAVWLAGAAVTILPLPTRQPADVYVDHLRRMITDARPSLVLVGDPLTGLTEPLAATDLATFLAHATTEPATPVRPAQDDLAILQYTSGSTRHPRGVPVTHGQLAANVAAIGTATRHDQVHGCLLSWLPLCHDLGLVGGLILPMSCGCPLVLQSPAAFAARPMSWFEAITSHRATATAAPNFAWGLMARLLDDAPAVRLDSLRLVLTGAEPIDPAAMSRFAEAGRRHGLDPSVITCAYGLAEATLAVTISAPGLRTDTVDPVALETRSEAVPVPGGRSLTRLGGPVPGVRLRIVDRDGRETRERRVGRIEVAGPSVMRGYWGRPERTGWLDTGDLGYLADGDLVVCGRESDVLFAAGRNVYPQDVEAAANTVPGVRVGNAAAFGVDGRLVVAVESRATDTEALRSAVRTAVVAEVGLTPRAVAVLPPGALPKTTSGKVRRAESRRLYLTGWRTSHDHD